MPFAANWCQLNLDVPGDTITGDADFPLSPPGDVHQSWVGATVRDAGVVAGGFGAVAVAHACEDASPTITVHLVFADGFESGDTSRWS